ncbi:MAG: ribbon-helix-helix domain-containing protein [Burkholderiaceae bacterium]
MRLLNDDGGLLGQDHRIYQSQTRALRLDGVLTSLRLENQVWRTVERVARAERVSVTELLASLHRQARSTLGDDANFASFVRVTMMRYLNQQIPRSYGSPSWQKAAA